MSFKNLYFRLKAGCLTLGIIYLILDILNSVGAALLISHFYTDSGQTQISPFVSWNFLFPDGTAESTWEDGKVGREVYIGQCVLSLIMSAISIATSTLLIVGVCTANYNYIYPTLIWIPAFFIIRIVSLVIFVLFDFSDVDATDLIVVFIDLGIVSLCWLCVHSYWQQVIVSILFGLQEPRNAQQQGCQNKFFVLEPPQKSFGG